MSTRTTSAARLKGSKRLRCLPAVIRLETAALIRRFVRSRVMLLAVTRVEFRKKYAGSILGLLWHPLYAVLLLSLYSFVFLVVFPTRFEGVGGTFDHVLLIFAGLIPFLGFSDALSTSVNSIKPNIGLVKNTVFPIELIPVKQLLVSMGGLMISLGILLAMIAPTSYLGWHLLYLPVPVVMLFVFTLSAIWVLSALAVLVPDLTYIVNLTLLAMMFVSPIALPLSDVPARAIVFMYVNPLTYLIESFRFAFLGMRTTSMWFDAVFFLVSSASLIAAGTFFRRLMPIFSDYE